MALGGRVRIRRPSKRSPGDRRAASAKSYLQTLGIPATRIEVISKGDMNAIENGSDADMAKDRRVEIIFLKR